MAGPLIYGSSGIVADIIDARLCITSFHLLVHVQVCYAYCRREAAQVHHCPSLFSRVAGGGQVGVGRLGKSFSRGNPQAMGKKHPWINLPISLPYNENILKCVPHSFQNVPKKIISKLLTTVIHLLTHFIGLAPLTFSSSLPLLLFLRSPLNKLPTHKSLSYDLLLGEHNQESIAKRVCIPKKKVFLNFVLFFVNAIKRERGIIGSHIM